MDTAPKDGTRVLISDNGQAFIARFWMDEWRCGNLPGDLAFPDGWMPLPAGMTTREYLRRRTGAEP
jgi:hypothetical protein